MNENTGVLLLLGALFAWQFYKHRKAILYNMKLYGEYFTNVIKQKVNEKKHESKKKNERR